MYAPQVAAVGTRRRSSSRLSPPRLVTRSSENNSCFAKESSHNVTVTRDFWPSFFVTILTHLSPLFICWNIYQVLCAVVHAIHTILATFWFLCLLFLYLSIPSSLGMPINRMTKWDTKGVRPEKRELHELLYTEIVKPWNIWFTTG